ncbi:VrrA/YqfQ family protein [Virgibacillus ainsalahensis]
MFPTQGNRDFHPSQWQQPDNNFLFPNQRLNRYPNTNNRKSVRPKQLQDGLMNRGVDGVSKTLNNVQQVLKVVQTTAPIIEEYGPMVKNLPAMYRMMKAFKEIENTSDMPDTNDIPEKEENSLQQDETIKDIGKHSEQSSGDGTSSPKLFI